MNKFQPKKQQEQTDIWYTPIPLNVVWAIYARQSTPAQLKKHTQSTEMQTGELEEFLIGEGVTGKIRLFDADLGLSGTLRIDERTALQELVGLIEADVIKAVLVYQISRLFRDDTGVQYNTFADICKRHNCILITSDRMIFNFNNPIHMKMFRMLAEMAAEYIPQHIKGVLHPARLRKARKGLYAGLGPVPSGYIVDYDEDSKTFGKIIPYVPHKERVFLFFERFYMLQGNLGQLCRELDELSPLFSPFGPEVDKRNASRWKKRQVSGGYGLTRKALEKLLCNPVYIGWWVVEGNIVSCDNHERIIDKEHEYLFWYAFNQLSPYMTNGEENVNRQNISKHPRRFFQKGTDAISGLLKNRISSPGFRAYLHMVMPGEPYYQFIPEEKANTIVVSGTDVIKADIIDNTFTELFFQHLQEAHDLDGYRQWVTNEVQKHNTLISSLKNQLLQIDIQQESILDEIRDLRTGVKMKLRKAKEENSEIDINALEEVLNAEIQPMIAKQRKRFEVLETSKEAVSIRLTEEKGNESITTIRNYADFQTELEKLIEVWNKKPMKAKRDFVNLFVTNAVFQVVAPHWISLTLYWSHPAWDAEILYIPRQRTPIEYWTDQENEIIKAYYANASQEELLPMIPSKSWASIARRASMLGIKRDGRKAHNFPLNIAWADWQFMQEKGIEFTSQVTKFDFSSAHAHTPLP